MIFWSAIRRDDRGASAVEFALVVILLTFILLGIVQFGISYSQWQQIVHSAREGVRWASLRVPAADVQTRITNAAAPLVPASIDIQPGDYETRPAGEQVSVTVQYDSVVLGPFMGSLLHASGAKRLTSTATMRLE